VGTIEKGDKEEQMNKPEEGMMSRKHPLDDHIYTPIIGLTMQQWRKLCKEYKKLHYREEVIDIMEWPG